uniref:Uncharacterized protein n=1 Tax=Anguilla anguilla TaxID=7936 RepID=A0A0E9PKT3_ANGAN
MYLVCGKWNYIPLQKLLSRLLYLGHSAVLHHMHNATHLYWYC